MKIAFDAKRITHNATGLGNYSRFVVNGLASFFPENNYLLYSPSPGSEALRQQVSNSSTIKFLYPSYPHHKKLKFLWRSFWISKELQRQKVDLFHGLSNELPLNIKSSGIPSVVTIHDLIFLRYPRFYKPLDRAIYTFKFKKACEDATRIVAVSQSTKNDIVKFFGIEESKIKVLYQGCNKVFGRSVTQADKDRVAAKYQLSTPFVLYVGSVERRKNLMVIAKAMKKVDKEVTLVAIGKETPYADEVKEFIKSNSLEKRVKMLNNVSFEDLPIFYSLASVFVYPSLFEGFGIPVLEALSAGIPVIAATGSCLEEAGGSNSLYINPDDHNQLGAYINEILHDSRIANEMVVKGKEHLKKFEPSILSSQMIDFYREVVGV